MRGDADALAGVRVIDRSSGRVGPLAGMLFADFGAEVLKISDVGRDDEPGRAVWDRGKSLVDPRAFDSLIRGADVLVGSAPGDADRARELNPSLVVLRTPPTLGPAPWAGGDESDALITAWFGIPLRQASFDGGPIDSIYPVVTTIQGVWAATCAVAALIERERSGLGQVVTVSGEHGAMIAAAGALTFTHAALAEAEAQPRRRIGGPGGSVPFYRTYRCGDGEWLFFAALTPRFTQLGFEALGLTDLFDDPRLEGRGRAGMLDPAHSPWVIDTIAQRFATRARDEWLAALREIGCPAGAVLERDDWLDHPQVGAIGMRVEIDDPLRGTVVMPGVPLRLSATPGRVRGAAPIDTSDIASWEPRAVASHEALEAPGPLAGLRVLDLGAIIAGPFAASLLGDLGADVIKVEPLSGDSFRGPGFASYNKGQRGIALDLRRGEGRDAFLDLVRTADVVVDNYRPGVLERLDITWDALRAVNPNVISASITGFGEGGPHGGDAGFDPVLQAMSGIMKAQGGDSDPVFFTVPVNDVAGAATLAFGTTLALFHRERTGVAQKVTTSLAAMACLLQTEALVRYEGRPGAERGSRDHVGPKALERFYRAADGWFRLHASDVDEVDVRLHKIGVEAIGDVETPISAWASALPRDEALRRLFDAGVPAVAARRVSEIAADPDAHAHGLIHVDPRPDRDGCTSGRHAHFSRTMRTDALASPRLGEHTAEVFAEIGYAPADIETLIASNAAAGE